MHDDALFEGTTGLLAAKQSERLRASTPTMVTQENAVRIRNNYLLFRAESDNQKWPAAPSTFATGSDQNSSPSRQFAESILHTEM